MYNNEEIGMSAEVAIADIFGVSIDDEYRTRSHPSIVNRLRPIVTSIFINNEIPLPLAHIAAGQNPIDFMLDGDKTLSVKSNQRQLGKVAPQRVAQPTSSSFFPIFAQLTNGIQAPADKAQRVSIFKQIVFTRIDEMLQIYWSNLFECDYLVYFYDVLTFSEPPKAVVFTKVDSPKWDKAHISFTKPTAELWNESNTIKYHGVTIGEFQIHTARDNFKFRFNIKGITELTKRGVI